jgi:hypothetical protein
VPFVLFLILHMFDLFHLSFKPYFPLYDLQLKVFGSAVSFHLLSVLHASYSSLNLSVPASATLPMILLYFFLQLF